MNMRLLSKISVAFIFIFLVVLIIFYFQGNKRNIDKGAFKKANVSISSGSADEIFTEKPGNVEADDSADAAGDSFLQVNENDCKSGCASFQLAEDVTYCKQICGLIELKKNVLSCSDLSGLEQDYCYKDQAIMKADSKICDKIEDSGIASVCKKRF